MTPATSIPLASTSKKKEHNKLTGPLGNILYELITTEFDFYNHISYPLAHANYVEIANSKNADAIKRIHDFIKPYQDIIATQIFIMPPADINSLDKLLLNGEEERAINIVCTSIETNLANKQKAFSATASQATEFNLFATDVLKITWLQKQSTNDPTKGKEITIDTAELTTLPTQRLAKYPLFLMQLITHFKKTNTNGKNKNIIAKLNTTYAYVDNVIHKTMAAKTAKEHNQINELFITDKEIAALFKEHRIDTIRTLDSKIGSQISTLIRTNSNYASIANILEKKYRITTHPDTIQKIKTSLYLAKLDTNIRQILKAMDPKSFSYDPEYKEPQIKLHANNPDTTTKMAARLAGYRSTTDYIINEINKLTLQKRNMSDEQIKKMTTLLQKIGLNPHQATDVIANISQPNLYQLFKESGLESPHIEQDKLQKLANKPVTKPITNRIFPKFPPPVPTKIPTKKELTQQPEEQPNNDLKNIHNH